MYDQFQNLTVGILKQFKQGDIKLLKVTAGVGAADNPGAPTITEYALDAVAKGVSFEYLKMGFAVKSDIMVTAAVLPSVTVTLNDFIQIDGVKYKIISDESVPAAGTVVAWKFIVRKGG